MNYRVLTFGPWDCDGPDSGDPIYVDGSRLNGNFFAGNPTLDGVSPQSKRHHHRWFPGMLRAGAPSLVKAQP